MAMFKFASTNKLIIFILIMVVQSCQTRQNIQKNNDYALVGSWKFIADQELDAGNNLKNEDKQVDGLLIYTADKKMSVQLIWHGGRASLMNDTIMKHDGLSTGVGLGLNTWTLEQTSIIFNNLPNHQLQKCFVQIPGGSSIATNIRPSGPRSF